MEQMTREKLVAYCLTFPDSYEDYPFHDTNWTVMRCSKNNKIFAMIYERDEQICVNVKCDPEWILFWRTTYHSVIPGFHMNKKHWNTVIMDGLVPVSEIERMIGESYDLIRLFPPEKFQRNAGTNDCND